MSDYITQYMDAQTGRPVHLKMTGEKSRIYRTMTVDCDTRYAV